MYHFRNILILLFVFTLLSCEDEENQITIYSTEDFSDTTNWTHSNSVIENEKLILNAWSKVECSDCPWDNTVEYSGKSVSELNLESLLANLNAKKIYFEIDCEKINLNNYATAYSGFSNLFSGILIQIGHLELRSNLGEVIDSKINICIDIVNKTHNVLVNGKDKSDSFSSVEVYSEEYIISFYIGAYFGSQETYFSFNDTAIINSLEIYTKY